MTDAALHATLKQLVEHLGIKGVTPPEKLRKDFQQAEAARVLAAARELRPLPKRILKLLQTTPDTVGQRTIAERLGRSVGGQSWMDLGKAIKELAALGFVHVKERVGVASTLRATIAEKLSFYNATEAEVEAVYQNVLFEIASEDDA